MINRVSIRKVSPRTCKVCEAAATHSIVYDDGSGEFIQGHIRVPKFQELSCDQHVPGVTAIVLLQAGFIQEVQDQGLSHEPSPLNESDSWIHPTDMEAQ